MSEYHARMGSLALSGIRAVLLDIDGVLVVSWRALPGAVEALARVRAGRGARLVAMHRNLSWRTDAGMQLDTGAFLAGLEAASGVTAEVVGKPSGAFFATALARLGRGTAEALMVGDDVSSDVLAAQRHGITGVLVRTGKYDPRAVERAGGVPDHVLDSVAGLPGLLGLG